VLRATRAGQKVRANLSSLQAHGWLMGIALIIILPISAVIAATLRSILSPSYWFQIHRALGVSVPIILIL
jgi:hypothetical protein